MATKEEFASYIAKKNLSDDIDPASLVEMGRKICTWFDEDIQSRRDWEDRYNDYLKLAAQVKETKTFPWPKAANVKFPLLATAALQFAARAYPALVPGPNLVAGLVIGQDTTGNKGEIAKRIGRHMSYQLMCQMKDWEEEMDRLCFILPIAGCLFKKTFYDQMEERNCSELVLPTELVVDYYAKTIETASRKSQILWMTENDLVVRVNKGLFNDLKYGEAQGYNRVQDAKDQIDGTKEPSRSPATPHKIIECHCSWDLDGDGYSEPYIVTVHYDTKQVARVIARFDAEGIETIQDKNGKERLVRIKPIEYFTKFGFIPNPDGGIYDVGFGLLLGGINEAVNAVTNMLLDGGTVNNLQAGFLGRGIRVRSGNTRFIPGEWKPVDFTGDDIKKHIFPLPTKEPSDVLFKLLETLVTSGKELASVAEIFVGKMPGQNTPATTTMATIEQGLKVFTAIYKRIYRALGKEYEKLFRLNAIHLPDEVLYFTINEPDGPQSQAIVKTDYDLKNISVKPNADPNIVSSAQKMMKVQSYGVLLQLGTINPKEYSKRFLEAVEAENISGLMGADPQPGQPQNQKQPYQAPPSPDQQKLQAEMQIKQAEGQQKAQLAQQQAQLKAFEAQLDAKSKELDMRIKVAEAQLEERKAQLEMMHTAQQAKIDQQVSMQEHNQNVVHTQQDHEQGQQHKQQEHQMKMHTAKQMAEAKAEAVKKVAAAKPKPKEGK